MINKWILVEAYDDVAVVISPSIIPKDTSSSKGILFIEDRCISVMLDGRSYNLECPSSDEMINKIRKHETVVLSEEGANSRCWVVEVIDG